MLNNKIKREGWIGKYEIELGGGLIERVLVGWRYLFGSIVNSLQKVSRCSTPA